ncbi:MAG TPA: LytTR family DNA-binding domain-containing protein [Thermoanaerobaculia bacterium]|nr:LytTR family DNA-binding domain-containing protein [Thermoanaerobaculia bacterium]
MSRICALVVDDERLARQRIRDLLRGESDIDVEEAKDGVAAIERLRQERFDLAFLDVQMPEKDGFDVLRETDQERRPLVIFVTAFEQYAVRAFEARAIDYLLKPVEERRFREALQRAREELADESREDRLRLKLLLEQMQEKSETIDRFLVRKNQRIVLLPARQVQWMKAEGNYVRLQSRGGSYLTRATISALARSLDRKHFARVHRSIIVNLDSVREIAQLFHGEYEIVMKDDARLPLSRSYRDALLRGHRLG